MYNYQELERDLLMGREIEFKIDSNQYGIMRWQEGWSFYKNNKAIFEEYKDVFELISDIRIDGKTLKYIFDNTKFESDNLTIF